MFLSIHASHSYGRGPLGRLLFEVAAVNDFLCSLVASQSVCELSKTSPPDKAKRLSTLVSELLSYLPHRQYHCCPLVQYCTQIQIYYQNHSKKSLSCPRVIVHKEIMGSRNIPESRSVRDRVQRCTVFQNGSYLLV